MIYYLKMILEKMESSNKDENYEEEYEDEDVDEDYMEKGFVVELLPDNNILMANKRKIYLFYINSLEKKDHYFLDNNTHKHCILDVKFIKNNLIVTSDNRKIIIWEYTKNHFIQLNKKINIDNSYYYAGYDDDDDIDKLRLIKSQKYPKSIYIIFNKKIIQYDLITGEQMLKYLLNISYELTKEFHEFLRPFTFYDKKVQKEYFFFIKSDIIEKKDDCYPKITRTIIKLSEKNKIVSEFNVDQYYKNEGDYFIGKNEKQNCFYIFVNQYNSLVCNIYCYDFNFKIVSSLKIKYTNTLLLHTWGNVNFEDHYEIEFILSEFVDIDKFYFIYLMNSSTPWEVNTIGLGTSENNKKNIPLHIGAEDYYHREGINFLGIKILNETQLLVWMGDEYKVIPKNQFHKDNCKGLFDYIYL